MVGERELAEVNKRWLLSLERRRPIRGGLKQRPQNARSIKVDGEEVAFTGGFTDLHTEVYRRVVAGEGFGIVDAYPSIQRVYNL